MQVAHTSDLTICPGGSQSFRAQMTNSERGKKFHRPVRSEATDRIDIAEIANIMGPPAGAFVYQLGHGPLKAERRVRFPYALPKFLEPVINFFQFLSVQCKHIPALRLGWQTRERIIRVM